MLSYKLLTILLSIFVFLGFVTSVSAATFEEQVVSLINSERQKQGLSVYNYSDKLFQASLKHNNTMFDCAKVYGVNSCFKHQVTLLNEPTLLSRIKATGYNPQAVAENIAWGYTTPQGVVNGWMNSSGHRANIMGNYKDIGCDYLNALNGSYKGMYWTCDFGKSFNTTSNPTPTPTRSISPTMTPTPTTVSNITPTPTKAPTTSISPTLTPGSREWWCKYAPGSYFCPNP